MQIIQKTTLHQVNYLGQLQYVKFPWIIKMNFFSKIGKNISSSIKILFVHDPVFGQVFRSLKLTLSNLNCVPSQQVEPQQVELTQNETPDPAGIELQKTNQIYAPTVQFPEYIFIATQAPSLK
ncbi:unnamed protein product [Paramecium octaurelia]|uniref:Uncharacterized protein n=1 Tax=Paramecium octaurelia TaxID=43137 RepID=A0A8S1T3Y6_PAROT|nr:unnamed protein product [Paramecium octaurelia]